MNYNFFTNKIIIIIASFMYTACSVEVQKDKKIRYVAIAKAKIKKNINSKEHVIKKGETLYSISKKYNISTDELKRINQIDQNNIIKEGQKLRIKQNLSTNISYRKPKKIYKKINSEAKKIKELPQKKEENITKTKKNQNRNKNILWNWPLKDALIKQKNNNNLTNGVNLESKTSEYAYASASGYVVYQGDQLKGYKNLIIIRHDKSYYSLYSNNKKILTNEGDHVNKGDKIATTNKINDYYNLYFEIRHKGKPVNPLKYLKKL